MTEKGKFTFKEVNGNEATIYDNENIEFVTNCKEYYIAVNNVINYKVTKDVYEKLMNEINNNK